MADPQRLLEAHVSFMEMRNQWAMKGLELSEAGKLKEAKEAQRKALEWEQLAKRLEDLTKQAPPW
jgi:hypothetical protein